MDLEPMGHRGEALQRIVAKASEKAGRSAIYRDGGIRVGAALCPCRGDPVHQPRRDIRLGLRLRELDPSVLLVAVRTDTEITQDRVGSATRERRWLSVP